MTSAIDHLLEIDSRARLRILTWSIFVTTVAGFAADFAGLDISTAACIAILAAVFSLAGQTVMYIRRYQTSDVPPKPKIQELASPLAKVATTTFVVLCLSTLMPSAVAPLINKRLEKLLASESPSPSELTQALRIATELGIQVREPQLSDAASRIEEAGYSKDWIAISPIMAPRLQNSIKSTLGSLASESSNNQQIMHKSFSEIAAKAADLRELDSNIQPNEVDSNAALLSEVVSLHQEDGAAWQAAAQMISLRSELQGKESALPNCFETQGRGGWNLTTNLMKYHDCTLDLNDITRFRPFTHFVMRDINGVQTSEGNIKPEIYLANGVIKYGGGQIIPVNHLYLQNCRFDIETPAVIPPAPGRALTKQLLTADLNDVSIELPTSDS
jgi:hypothetical protein